MSAIRSRGPIWSKVKSIKPHQLPVPVMEPSKRASVETSEHHGLWGFFNKNREALTEPKELNAHGTEQLSIHKFRRHTDARAGRAWTKKELSIKSLDDMHALWWKCHLELNRLSTELEERKRLNPGYGTYELESRQETVSDLKHCYSFIQGPHPYP
jgi:large subunit ribosomal protein L47